MSLPNTLDSVESSVVESPSASQQQQVFVTTKSVKNQHLTLAQMRGVIQIFNHYFPKNNKKRLSREEKNRKWISYKNRIYQEYKRIVVGKYSSEKALVKRYSEPLSFIKYRLKRAKDLKVSDLSEADRQYYFEIGGLENVNELIKLTYNIDSVEQMSHNFQNYNNNRKRRRIDMNDATDNNGDNHNHNHNVNQSTQVIRPQPIDTTNQSPMFTFQQIPKSEKNESMTQALYVVKDKMDIFEREQLDKKKIEMFEITKQKAVALKQSVETIILNEPHLIGCIPGIEDQESVAFDCWLAKYKHVIKDDPAVKHCMKSFLEQMTVLRMDNVDWKIFLARWKMRRIFYNDDFSSVWNEIKNDLKIKHVARSTAASEQKEENDDLDIV